MIQETVGRTGEEEDRQAGSCATVYVRELHMWQLLRQGNRLYKRTNLWNWKFRQDLSKDSRIFFNS